jgi:hypothetical protein
MILCLSFITGCKSSKEKDLLQCSLVELIENPVTKYFDAVIKVENLELIDAQKSEFTIYTLTKSFQIEKLPFTEDGQDPDLLEAGDVFRLQLQKPDWKIIIMTEIDIVCSLNFWEELPFDSQWHPTKSEAMEVAENIKMELTENMLKPAAELLPEEWRFAGERLPDMDDPCGEVTYQKLRAENIKEEVYIKYCFLTDADIKELSAGSEAAFLTNWIDWGKKTGKLKSIAGHEALYSDAQDKNGFDWTYSYVYIESEIAIEIRIYADPMEWVKTKEEKIIEGKKGVVFLRYGYGPVGDEQWQVMIEIGMDGEGNFHKRSKERIIVEKDFSLEQWELDEIQASIDENSFKDLRSRTGVSGEISSFLSVRYGDQYHTVEIKGAHVLPFENIEQTIRNIVLPKVDERQDLKQP